MSFFFHFFTYHGKCSFIKKKQKPSIFTLGNTFGTKGREFPKVSIFLLHP